MGYRLVTGLYVTNYICLAPELLLTESGIAFKSKLGKVTRVQGNDMDAARTMKVARGYQYRIRLRPSGYAIFEGFTQDDIQKIRSFAKTHHQIEISSKETSIKGWNWGRTEFDGNIMSFVVDDGIAFEVPLPAVQTANAQKYEATIEFAPVRIKTGEGQYRAAEALLLLDSS